MQLVAVACTCIVASAGPAARLRAKLRPRAKTGAATPEIDGAALRRENAATVRKVSGLLDEGDGKWESVVSEGRVRVWKRAAGRHACVLAKGELDASPDAVYDLLAEARRAGEYNEFCVECVDVARLDKHTKVSWSATKPFGPFKPRDFVTLCHFCKFPGGARCVVNRATTFAGRPPTTKYRRGEVVLAATVIEAAAGGKTRLTLLTQVNPRGAIDSSVGAKIANALVVRSPRDYFEAVEKAAQKGGR